MNNRATRRQSEHGAIMLFLWHIASKLIRIENRLTLTVTKDQLDQAVKDLKNSMGSNIDLTDELSSVKDDIKILRGILPPMEGGTPDNK